MLVSRACNLPSRSYAYAHRGETEDWLTADRAMGMRPIVVDSGVAKKDFALKMGAEAFVDFTEEQDAPAKVRGIADGIGAHGVLVTAYQAYKGKVNGMPACIRCTDVLKTHSAFSGLASGAALCALPYRQRV